MIYISTVRTLPEIPELNEEDSLCILYKNTETVKMADVEILCNMLSKKHFEEFEDKNDMLVVFGIILSQLKEDEDCILVDNTLPVPKRFEDRVKKLAKQTKTAKKKSTAKRTTKKKPAAEPPKAKDKEEDMIPAKEAPPLEAHTENPDIPEVEEAMENEDAEGEELIGSPQEINDLSADFDAKIAEEGVSNRSGVTASQDMSERTDSLLGVSEEAWGLDEITFAEPEEPEGIFAGLIDDPTSVPDDAPEKLQKLIKADAPDDYPFPVSMFYMDIAQTIANAKSDAEIETELTAVNNGEDSLWKKTKPVLAKAKEIVGNETV